MERERKPENKSTSSGGNRSGQQQPNRDWMDRLRNRPPRENDGGNEGSGERTGGGGVSSAPVERQTKPENTRPQPQRSRPLFPNVEYDGLHQAGGSVRRPYVEPMRQQTERVNQRIYEQNQNLSSSYSSQLGSIRSKYDARFLGSFDEQERLRSYRIPRNIYEAGLSHSNETDSSHRNERRSANQPFQQAFPNEPTRQSFPNEPSQQASNVIYTENGHRIINVQRAPIPVRPDEGTIAFRGHRMLRNFQTTYPTLFINPRATQGDLSQYLRLNESQLREFEIEILHPQNQQLITLLRNTIRDSYPLILSPRSNLPGINARNELPSGFLTEYWPIQVRSDGSCFFNAVSYCLFGDQSFADGIRVVLLDFLFKNKAAVCAAIENLEATLGFRYRSFDQLIYDCLHDWADELSTFSGSGAIQRPIYLFSSFNMSSNDSRNWTLPSDLERAFGND